MLFFFKNNVTKWKSLAIVISSGVLDCLDIQFQDSIQDLNCIVSFFSLEAR